MPDLTTSRSTSSTASPARAPPTWRRDLGEALELGPEHLSCYELEAKPGTRFTHAHGAELERAGRRDGDVLRARRRAADGAGYRWYETANFCRADGRRDLRAQHNLAYWLGRDYLGLGIGAVSTIAEPRGGTRPGCASTSRRSRPAAVRRASSRTACPRRPAARTHHARSAARRAVARSPVSTDVLDDAALERLQRLGLVERANGTLSLTARGRMLGGGVTADLLA